jgi:hypothetical protein
VAYSAADVASADRTLAAADKPMLGALAVYSPTAAEWRTGGSFAAGSDTTVAGYAAARAYDGYTDLPTKPALAGTVYYMLNLSGSPVTFDGVAIIGHNFASLGINALTLQIADNNAFTTNLIDIAAWDNSDTSERLTCLTLSSSPGAGTGTAQRYSNVPYVRLKFEMDDLYQPEIGEFVLFKRTQLQWKPNRPYNSKLTVQSAQQQRADSGVVTTYARSRGARSLEAELTVSGSSKITEVETWWDDTRQGTRQFVWVENPNSEPISSVHLMSFGDDDPQLDFDESGPNFRQLRLSAVEQGPDFLRLE